MTDHEIEIAIMEAIDALKAKGYRRPDITISFTADCNRPQPPWIVTVYNNGWDHKLYAGRFQSAPDAINGLGRVVTNIEPVFRWDRASVAATLGIHPDGSLIEEPAYAVAAE